MLKRYALLHDRVVHSEAENAPIMVFVNPDEEERRTLIEAFSVDEHTLLSSLDPEELARIEFEPNHAALIFKTPRNYSGADQLLFKASTMGAFLFADRLIVVAGTDTPLFEGKIFSKVPSLPDLLLKLIHRAIFHFLEHLKIINMLSEELEHKINLSLENKYLINLFTLEKSLVYYLNSINSNGVLIERLKHNQVKMGFTTEQLELLDDLLIEHNQCYRQAEIYSNILASLMDARASIVSNNLNVLMKTLNIITIGIMVPTLVVSIFSMNVPLPISQELEAFQSFWWIMLLAGVSGMGVFALWRLRRW